MLDTNTALRLSHIPPTTLHRYKSADYLIPAIVGRAGRGCPDRYTYAQVYGLIVVQAYREKIGCTPANARAILAKCSKITDEEFAEIAGPDHDFTEEPDVGELHAQERSAAGRLALLNVWPKEVFQLIMDRLSELFCHYRANHATVQLAGHSTGRTSPRSKGH